jgi:hypothetical protein
MIEMSKLGTKLKTLQPIGARLNFTSTTPSLSLKLPPTHSPSLHNTFLLL